MPSDRRQPYVVARLLGGLVAFCTEPGEGTAGLTRYTEPRLLP